LQQWTNEIFKTQALICKTCVLAIGQYHHSYETEFQILSYNISQILCFMFLYAFCSMNYNIVI